MNALELTGRARTHVVDVPDLHCTIHRDVVAPLRALSRAAWTEAGIELAAVSAFRDFERQRTIWNAKWRGERALLDRPIADLNLSVRARKCMVRLGLTTIGELLRRTGDDLLECKNFGVTSLNEVREKLPIMGLKLRGD